MQTQLNSKDGQQRLDISGDLDQFSLQKDYWSGLNASEQKALVKQQRLDVCLAKVERADTAGLAWLINLVANLKGEGIDTFIHNAPPKLMSLAELSNAQSLLNADIRDK